MAGAAKVITAEPFKAPMSAARSAAQSAGAKALLSALGLVLQLDVTKPLI
jgi:hypothetical protein